MIAHLISSINFLMNHYGKVKPSKAGMKVSKSEIKKIENMGLFSAASHLKNK